MMAQDGFTVFKDEPLLSVKNSNDVRMQFRPGLSESTLAKLRLNGNGPAYCKLGRRVVYRGEDLEVWLASRVARDTSDADARLPQSLTGLVNL
jgi:hypothetical protein